MISNAHTNDVINYQLVAHTHTIPHIMTVLLFLFHSAEIGTQKQLSLSEKNALSIQCFTFVFVYVFAFSFVQCPEMAIGYSFICCYCCSFWVGKCVGCCISIPVMCYILLHFIHYMIVWCTQTHSLCFPSFCFAKFSFSSPFETSVCILRALFAAVHFIIHKQNT